MKPLRLALLIGVCTVTGASAQTAPQRDANTPTTWEGFTSHQAPRTVMVIDEAGIETRGRLVFLTQDELTIAVDVGRDQTLHRSRIAAVYQPGDSVKNGAAIGLLIGAGMGLRVRNDEGCWNAQLTARRQCTTKENAGFAAVNSIMAGGIGAGIGALVDKLVPGRRLLYERPKTSSTIISLKPSLAPSYAGLRMGVSW